eukprot:COSAG01_NODE_2246_length_8080_cov_4.007017_7_plen_91_part_00
MALIGSVDGLCGGRGIDRVPDGGFAEEQMARLGREMALAQTQLALLQQQEDEMNVAQAVRRTAAMFNMNALKNATCFKMVTLTSRWKMLR